jgi:hypothetical protein
MAKSNGIKKTAEEILLLEAKRNAVAEKIRSEWTRDDSTLLQRVETEIWVSALPPEAKLIALAMRKHASKSGDDAYPSLSRLEHLTGLCRKTVIRYRDVLVDEGWLVQRTEFRGRKSNTYSVRIPDNTLTELDGAILTKTLNGVSGTPFANSVSGTPLSTNSVSGTPLEFPTKTLNGVFRASNGVSHTPNLLIPSSVVVEDITRQSNVDKVSQDNVVTSPSSVINIIDPARKLHAVVNKWGSRNQQSGQPASLDTCEAFIAGSIKPYSGLDASIIETAISDTLLTMAAKYESGDVKNGNWVSACKYFSTTLRATVQRSKFEAEKLAKELAMIDEIAGVRVEGERAIQVKRAENVEKHAAISQAAAEKRAASRVDRFSERTSPDSPLQFDPRDTVAVVYKCYIKGDDANELLSIPGSTREIVRSAIRDASVEQSLKPGEFEGAAPIKSVMDWCSKRVRRSVAHSRAGTIGDLYGETEYVTHDGYGAVSKKLLVELHHAYPDVVYVDGTIHSPDGCEELRMIVEIISRNIKNELGWDLYGERSKSSIESAIRNKISEYHRLNEEKRKSDADARKKIDDAEKVFSQISDEFEYIDSSLLRRLVMRYVDKCSEYVIGDVIAYVNENAF